MAASSPQRWLFIMNPRSGHIRSRRGIVDRIEGHIRRIGPGAGIACTARPGHATDLARNAVESGIQRIVAIGGDGTVNEIARALVGTEASLGLVPLGSGNGLARDLGIPLDPGAALDCLETAVVRTIDSGLFGSRDFFCTAGTGLDAEVVRRFNSRKRRGFASYVVDTARCLLAIPPFRYRAVSDAGETLEGKASLIVAANAAQFGNGARVAPDAILDDGMLDLVAIPPITPANAPFLAWGLFFGRLTAHRGVGMLRAREVSIERAAPGPFHTDGELWAAMDVPLVAKVRPRSLQVLVPRRA